MKQYAEKLKIIVSKIEKIIDISYNNLQEEVNEFRENYKEYERVLSLERPNLSLKEIFEFEQRTKIANEKFWRCRQI